VGGSTFALPGGARVATLAQPGGASGRAADAPMPVDALLAALPPSTIVGGRIVDVRAGVSAALGLPAAAAAAGAAPSSSSAILATATAASAATVLVETPVVAEMRARAEAAAGAGTAASVAAAAALPGVVLPYEVATLAVRVDSATAGAALAGAAPRPTTLLLKLRADDTIGDAFRFIATHLSAAGIAKIEPGGGFELRAAAPPRVFR
jgi:hypothetical protein